MDRKAEEHNELQEIATALLVREIVTVLIDYQLTIGDACVVLEMVKKALRQETRLRDANLYFQ